VDLEKRRVVQLLADRSAETSKAWLRKHPEIDLVSRDRGKIFREAATGGAPQAKQAVDRFHLQKNFAEGLEKFFRKQERSLKKATQRSAGKAPSAASRGVPEKIAQERRARHRQRVSMHKRIWKLYRQGYHKEQIAQLVGISSRKVYRALEQEASPPPRRRSRSASIVDPYLSYLTARWNQGCHNVARLYEEIVAQGYTGTQRTLQMRLRPLRQKVARPVSKQTVIWDKPPSPRGVALMMVRPAQTSGIAELIAFVEGLADDAQAVANGCTESWNNGMVEGFINKVKWIKRSSYGQAGFPLLQRRVLLHPTREVC
jgi:transposase